MAKPFDQRESQASTQALVDRARSGDAAAGNHLFTRIVRRVRKWARGRLPHEARDLNDTADVVQDAAAGVWRNLSRIELEAPGDLEQYLMKAVRNRIRDEARRVSRKPSSTELDSGITAGLPTPLEAVMSDEQSAAFQTAFALLTDEEREGILARYEYGYSYDEVAVLLKRPSAAAARMAVNRSAAKLAALLQNR